MPDDNRRDLPLTGGYNFRDIGGYTTSGGGRVAWGRVYRSAALGDLTDADIRTIETLGLRCICDLRSSRERIARPSRIAASDTLEFWGDERETSGADLPRMILQAPDATPVQARDAMLALYREMPEEHADAFAALFHRIAAGGMPLLFHCAAGKDRTGVAAALLLDLLGVPRDQIESDYLLTNRSVERLRANARRALGAAGPEACSEQVLEPVLRADRSYLAAALDAIGSNHGSTQAYVEARLGLTRSMIAAIRRDLTAG